MKLRRYNFKKLHNAQRYVFVLECGRLLVKLKFNICYTRSVREVTGGCGRVDQQKF